MKVALVVHDFLEGIGHGRYCIELARRFSHEHEVHVFANRFERSVDFNYQPRPVSALRFSALTSVLSFAPAAEKVLARENFDIVHAQGFSCWHADVITAHVCNAARYKQVPARGLLKKLFPGLVNPRERRFYENSGARAVIGVSQVVKGELEREYGCRDVEVVYHGVDTEQFAPLSSVELASERRREFGLRENAWTWMFAGEAVKGLEETIGALPKFPQAQLVVVSRSNLARFKRLAATLGVADRVLFHGPEANMPHWYQAADVFVYPSIYDTFGMVVAEAMACGIPAIVDQRIGAAEWIVDGENGFLCEPGNLVEVLKRITALDPQRLRAISRRASATALQYTWGECATRTLAIYERAIASRRDTK